MSNSFPQLPRRPSVAASMAAHAGVALQNWASRRGTASAQALLYQAKQQERRDRESGAMHDGLLR
ncbi:MAG TPA: hypothetical protein VGN49_02420 [Micrococcaceae bacterium]|nr:hypothetical protein [Micrococcaceae bacterium]